MADRNILVLVDEKTDQSLEALVKSIEAEGVKVERILRSTRTIVGAAPSEEAMSRVRNLEGIAAVREDQTISLPPGERGD